MYQNRPTSSPLRILMSTDQHDHVPLMCICTHVCTQPKNCVFITQQLANHNLPIFPDYICAMSPTCKIVHMCRTATVNFLITLK